MPGRPPNNAVRVQMMNAPYSPISGLRCATSAKAMHSGNRAKDRGEAGLGVGAQVF